MVVNFLLWIVFGLIAGAVAQYIIPGKDVGQSNSVQGFLITSALGILGALVGGYVSSRLFNWDVNSFSLLGLAVAIAGALLLLFLYRLLLGARRAY